ncbi:MAG: class I SAM-dependent methyltransferase [Anaerolineae bacterium]|nr:class I SAM-dependent methyltransferase [Anaerolineae bacterium]
MPASIPFDRASEYYDETRGFPPGVEIQVAALIAQAAHLDRTSRVLEIGVGTGRIGLPLSQHTAAYVGVDLSVPMMQRLQAKRQGEPIHCAQADATRLPCAANRFDAAVSVHVFHLIPGWRQALAELTRVLHPEGVLLNCWNGGREHPQVTRLWDAWNAAIPETRRSTVGADARTNPNFLDEVGWIKQGSEQVLTYPVRFKLVDHMDRLRRRIWSRLWKLTDDELQTGIAAVEAAAAQSFNAPDAELDQVGEFHVQAYRKPVV